ncbi:MAG: thioesterase family protein [Mogibacterium sp.]|nr:thioesterase family protein [Mogibacterium sp.]
MAELKPGITGSAQDTVTEERTAASMGSGGLRVYATPRMTAMMEYTAWASVEPYMEDGMGTVGTRLEISHVAASPVGAEISYESELTEVDRRRLVFSVRAFDDAGLIGEGIHERFIIDNAKFMSRAESKLENR